MRIIAGQAKGKSISIPPNSSIRPTSDRAKEAIFNVLFSLGGVAGKQVLDAFAGSGALGLEALSRGAAHAWFVDQQPAAISAVKQNLQALGFEEQATVVKAEVLRWCASQSTPAFDIAFCDPPYDFEQWSDLTRNLSCSILVAESRSEIQLDESWKVLKSKRYGSAHIVVAQKSPNQPAA